MPIYEYECRSCGKRTELIQRMDDPPLAACPACGGEVKKMFSAPAFQFKGTGWYATDYAAKGGKHEKSDKDEKSEKSEKGEGAAESKSESKSDTKTESKTESKSDTKKEAASTASKGSGSE